MVVKPHVLAFSCCILLGPGGESIVDVVPGGTELVLLVKMGSWAGRTHSPRQVYWNLLCMNSE